MKIDVTAIREGHSSLQRTETEFSEGVEWPLFEAGLEHECDIERTPYEIVVRVRFRGNVILACARCLKEYKEHVEGRCCVVARRSDGTQPVGYVGDDSLEYYYTDEEHEIDLGQAVYDELMTTLPMKPLCVESCEGPTLHRNEQAAHGDKQTEVDPRWAALQRLRQRHP